MNKQTFTIPDGCKAVTMEQVGNRIITTFEPIKKERCRVGAGEDYYYIRYDSTVGCDVELGSPSDDIYYDIGNYFQTEEQALRAAQRLKTALAEFWEEELK